MALVNFEDLPSTNTPINASNLNNNFKYVDLLSIPTIEITENADLNSYTTTGTYMATSNAIASSLSNCPVVYAFKLVVEATTTNNRLKQTIYPYNSNQIYTRTWFNNSWTNWSCLEQSTYSTTEQRIGTWIDGKPLYRITMEITGPTVATDGTIVNKNINITNLSANSDTLMVKNAFIYNSNRLLPLPYLNDAITRITKVFPTTATNIRITTNNISHSENNYIIILEYTKTTD